MNYELLAKLHIKENAQLKHEIDILRTRNDIIHNEVENLKALIRKLEDEKKKLEIELEKTIEYYENKLNEDEEENENKPFTYYT